MADFFTAYASYVIYFSDPNEYQFAVAIAGGTQLRTNPQNAAGIFGIAWPPPTTIGAKGLYAASDDFSITSPGSEIKNPGPSGLFMSPDVDSVEVPSQIPNPDPQIPNDSKPTIFYWSGFIARGGTDTITSDISYIPKRRWAAGFEYFGQAEGESNGIKSLRDASRTAEGFGGALRNDNNKFWTKTVDRFRVGYAPHISMERFYIRIRNVGTGKFDIWKCNGSVSALSGTRVYIDTDLTIKVYNVTSAPVETLRGTSTFPLIVGNWYQIQLGLTFSAGLGGAFGLILHGEGVPFGTNLVCDYDVTPLQGGMGQEQTHASSSLGTSVALANNEWEVDLDDWIGHDYPNNGTEDNPNSIDFTTGSHVKSVQVYAVGSGTSGFAGEMDYMNQMFNPTGVGASSQLTSTTPLAKLDGVTNATDSGVDDPTGVSYGAVCAIVSKYGLRLIGTNDGKLGYSVAGSETLTTVPEFTTLQYNEVAFLPDADVKMPASIVPFDVVYEKGNSTDTARVNALSAVVEYIGIWGAEDDQTGVMEVKPINYHNAYYPRIAASDITPDPSAVVACIGGTYVGNGTTTIIQLDVPCHWLMIRPVNNGNGGAIWMATGVGGHLFGQQGVLPPHMVRVFEQGGVGYVVVTSALAAINANGVTYQYTAFCDPTMRYNLCSSLMHDGNIMTTADYPLIIDNWEPEAAFFQFELQDTSTLVKAIYKGVGHSANTGTQFDGTAKTDVASFASGVLTTYTDLHRQSVQTTFSLWRSSDCSEFAQVQLHSYTGNGSGSRVITLPNTTGLYPLYVYIQAHNAKGWFRDPSHTGLHASDILTAADSTTAILGGGVDSVTVGLTCNTNAVDYDMFVIMGDSSGWNNGTFFAPTIPCDWFVDPGNPPADINIFAEGGLIIGGDPAISALRDLSGIYTMVPGKTNDTLYDRQTGQTNVDVKIPDPTWKTGFIDG